MNYCETCRYWQNPDPSHPIEGFGGCARIARGMYSPDIENTTADALVVDANGNFSGLKTKGDSFGCVLHEAAE